MDQARLERPEARLLAAATQEIAKKGRRGADIRNIAKLARTSSSRFHELWKSRENLIVHVFDQGWEIVERCINARLAIAVQTLDMTEILLSGVDGALDAFDENPVAVSAAVNIALTTVGEPIRDVVKTTPAYTKYMQIQERLEFSLRRYNMTADEATEFVQALFAVVTRRLILRSPLFEASHGSKYKRETFLTVVRRMIRGFIKPEDEPWPGPPEGQEEMFEFSD